jgi:flagellum-specific peptidoglycan hydrolase FlgJ
MFYKYLISFILIITPFKTNVYYFNIIYKPILILELTWDNIIKELKANGIKHIDVVLKQIKLETGNLKSNVCLNNNNLFGLTYKGERYLTFNHWSESIKCYKKVQNKMRHNENYYAFLKRIKYASDNKYINKLKKIK